MPSLQLDVTGELGAAERSALAADMCDAYAQVMQSDPSLMTVVVRTLPAGAIWIGRDPTATDAALLMCDVRAGRDRATRELLAEELVRLVAARTGIPDLHVKVEFTQHSGDEMYHPHLGGFNRDWTVDE